MSIVKLKRILFVSAGISLSAGILASYSVHAQDDEAGLGARQKSAVEAIVKSYILEHPEILIESLDKGRKKQEKLQKLKAQTAIKDNIEALTGAEAPFIGNPDADVTVVEFFDYNCGYCKRALPDIQNVIKADKNIRVVFQEMPILGPTSRTAARWALAAHKQGKYFEYHVALMNHRGQKNEEALEKIAKEVGLDVEQMKKDAGSREIENRIIRSVGLGRSIGVNGTPAFIVGQTFMPGYLGEDGLKQAIKAEREKNGSGD